MAEGGNSTVTEVKSDKMDTQAGQKSSASAHEALENLTNAQPIPSSRSALPSHDSKSDSSTPYSRADKSSNEYRTPSPMNRAIDVPSPRSTRSESDSTVRSGLPRGPFAPPGASGCKYETGMAHYRRRIPYSIGGDMLPSQTKVKKSLEPDDEKKLSGDMRELYDRIMPSADSALRRKKLVGKLEKLLNEKWPHHNIKVHVFGSSGNLLCSNDSDVDICITTTMKALERVCLLAKTLAEHGMERVVCVPNAKVPIVKIWDPEFQLACDMNVNNTAALENTRMVKTYVQIDPRVRPLAMVIKHWTQCRVLNDAALGGTLSSYTWICLIVNFLQTRKPKAVLPSLQQRPHQRLKDENGNLSSFADDVEALEGFGTPNKETIGELLFHFFRKYGHELDYEKHVISVRQGSLISKKEKGWHLMQNNRLCVEEPFNIDRNLGNTLDDTSFKGVHIELRRAFDLISQGKLAEACSKYEFPEFPDMGDASAGHEALFTRPSAQPRPTLTRSTSQQGRRGGNSQQTHNGTNHRNAGGRQPRGQGGRRSSGPATRPLPSNYAHGPSGLPPRLPQGGDMSIGNQIHDELFRHYQILQAQEAQLRQQMSHQRHRVGPVHANANAQFATQIQNGAAFPMSAYPHQGGFDDRRMSSIEPGPMSAPLRSMQNGRYQMPLMSPSHGSSRSPQPSTPSQSTTNPPSPSISSSQLANGEPRRGMQRQMTAGTSGWSARSQSQPPSNATGNSRPRPSFGRNPATPTYSQAMSGRPLAYPTPLQEYQQLYLQHKASESLQTPNMSPQDLQHTSQAQSRTQSPHLGPMIVDGSEEGMIPRQYAGYSIGPPRRQRPTTVQPIPPFKDLALRRSSASSNLNRSALSGSRSPSPAHSNASFDRPAPLSGNNLLSLGPSSLSATNQGAGFMDVNNVHRGPVIIDGSSDVSEYGTPPESVFIATNHSEVASLSDEHNIDTPSSASVATAHDQQEIFPLEPAPGYRMVESTPNMLQFGEFPGLVPTKARGGSQQQATSTVSSGADLDSTSAAVSNVPMIEPSNGLGINFRSSSSEGIMNTNIETSTSGTSATDIRPTPIPAPLLSPVREVRTPSPTTTRHSSTTSFETPKSMGASHVRSASGLAKEVSSSTPDTVIANKGKSKSETTQAVPRQDPITNGTPEAEPSAPRTPPVAGADQPTNCASPKQDSTQTSGWLSVSNKKKKNRKSGSIGSLTLMHEQNERKGG